MTQKPRAVRFSDQEEAEIQKFLELNPFLDFSTLARVAIKTFMEHPKIEMRPLPRIYHVAVTEKSPKRGAIIKNPATGQNELNIYNQ